MQLQAWFDGEASDGLAWHLASCDSCFAQLEELARIRSALRLAFSDVGDGFADTGDLADVEDEALLLDDAGLVEDAGVVKDAGLWDDPGSSLDRPTAAVVASSSLAGRGPWWRSRALVAVPVAVAVVAGLVFGVGQAPFHGTLSSARGAVGGTATGSTDRGASYARPPTDVPKGTPGRTVGGVTSPMSSGSSSVPGAPSTVAMGAGLVGPLSLAVVVPTQGGDAYEGSQVAQAVREAVREANASGGVGGTPVQLTVVSAEDASAVGALAGRVTAVVGGFDAAPPAGVPWILPADPWAGGASTMATELSPTQVGARLGQNLVQQGRPGLVGVVMGTGPDTALETGLAQEVPVTTVMAPPSGACLPAVTSLAAQGVTAVAVAGPPALAASCASALGAMGWSPPNGMLVAPSAAYEGGGGFELVPTTTLYTVLGLPWPDGASSGAARFRSAVPGDTSYRALVSYAAVELAVQAARDGTLTMALLSGGAWRNDLYDFSGLQNVGAAIVASTSGDWSPAP